MGLGNGSWVAAGVVFVLGVVGCTTEDGAGGAGSGSTSTGTTSASSTSSGSPTATCSAQCDAAAALASQLGCAPASTGQDCIDGCETYFANVGTACFTQMNAYEKCITANVDTTHCSCQMDGFLGCMDICTSATVCTTQACKAEAEAVGACQGM